MRGASLLATLLVILYSLTAASGTSVSLASDVPLTSFGELVIVEESVNPLIAIVTCTGGSLEADNIAFLETKPWLVQIEENGNNPDQFFLLPNDTSTEIKAGVYELMLSCGGNQSVTETAAILVNVFTQSEADDGGQAYFTNSLRTINISASTPPGTVIADYTAEVSSYVSGRAI